MTIRLWVLSILCLASLGCTGVRKNIAQVTASNFGADWIVVQYAYDGRPFHCWKLRDVAVDSSVGGNVNWQDSENGHLVHLTGWENRVQVVGGDFDGAARLVGVEASKCNNGRYPADVLP